MIDCHGHYTREPPAMLDCRRRQIDAINDPSQSPSPSTLEVSDDEIRDSLLGENVRLQRERRITATLFSPRAGGMGHHIGDARTSADWSIVSNDMIHRIATQLGFVGCLVNPDPPLSDRHWYPLWEKMVELGALKAHVGRLLFG